jgi:hypothetical protein
LNQIKNYFWSLLICVLDLLNLPYISFILILTFLTIFCSKLKGNYSRWLNPPKADNNQSQYFSVCNKKGLLFLICGHQPGETAPGYLKIGFGMKEKHPFHLWPSWGRRKEKTVSHNRLLKLWFNRTPVDSHMFHWSKQIKYLSLMAEGQNCRNNWEGGLTCGKVIIHYIRLS